MRIPHVNKYLYRRGGAESYMQAVASLQRDAGHDVAFFGMDHPENDRHTYAPYFPSYLELEPPPATATAKVAGFGRMVWSTSARQVASRRKAARSGCCGTGGHGASRPVPNRHRGSKPGSCLQHSLCTPKAPAKSGKWWLQNWLSAVRRNVSDRWATCPGSGRRARRREGILRSAAAARRG